MNRDHRPISLAQIRHHLEEYLGKQVTIRANRGRRRIVEREGTLEKTYPDVFLVRLGATQHNRSISFTYSDILTSDVEVLICGEGEPQKLEISAGS